jgi:hypothetical protein
VTKRVNFKTHDDDDGGDDDDDDNEVFARF